MRTHFETLDAMDGSGAAVQLLVARVSPGDVVHKLTNGDVYLRVGDSTMKLSPMHRQELLYDRGGSQYEATALAGTAVGDLNERQLAAF